ncbi:MAG: hypothetical protein INQ03_19980 [Candidatus Heimdallarchaeota archaeon]|nr:hypothetical protein [Candidatus Heimdallarchaeota archaeon]
MSIISRETLNNPSEVIFDIDGPKWYYWILLLFISLLFSIFPFLFDLWDYQLFIIPGAMILGTLIIATIWHRIGKRLVFSVAEYQFQRHAIAHDRIKIKQQSSSPILRFIFGWLLNLLGFKILMENQYFMEIRPKDMKIGIFSIKDLRITDILFSSSSFVFLFLVVLRILADWLHLSLDFLFSLSSLFIAILISPLLVCWLIPVIWLIEDAQIRSITPEQGVTSRQLPDNLRSGIFNKFLNFGGLISGFTILLDVISNEVSSSEYVITVLVFISLILGILASGLLVSSWYLKFFHANDVNNLRKELAKYIPLGMTVVKKQTNFSRHCRYCGGSRESADQFCQQCGAKY